MLLFFELNKMDTILRPTQIDIFNVYSDLGMKLKVARTVAKELDSF